jgi:hypothetical protein
MRAVQPCRRMGFPAEPLLKVRVLRQIRGQELLSRVRDEEQLGWRRHRERVDRLPMDIVSGELACGTAQYHVVLRKVVPHLS